MGLVRVTCDTDTMRALVQRVIRAEVRSRILGNQDPRIGTEDDGFRVVGQIGPGLCVFVGVTHTDTVVTADKMADKLWHLRILEDSEGVMNRSLSQIAGEGAAAEVLVVSQFTLYGDTARGRRPSWVEAAQPEVAEPLMNSLIAELQRHGATVASGVFRTDMQVELVNDGPVTVMLEI
jgi:D-tyrosyl-tRNA(Tyr) deacylase